MSKKQKPKQQQSNRQSVSKSVIRNAPVASYSQTVSRRPVFSNKGKTQDGRICVRHREYFGDLMGSVEFSCVPYWINPGNPTLFPWLSRMAANYESYRFNRLDFHYKTAAATSEIGSVIMSVDYDAADAPPASLQQVYQNWGSTDCQVWEPDKIVRCDRADLDKLKQRTIRTGPLAANLDIKTYDVGNINFCTTGQLTNKVIGRLWADYEVELITPQGEDGVAGFYSHMYTAGGGATRTIPFGLAPALFGKPPHGVAPNSLGVPFLVPGEYIVSVTASGVTFTNPPTVFWTGPGLLNKITALQGVIGVGGTAGSWDYKVLVADVSLAERYLEIDFTLACASLTSCNLYTAEYEYSTA